MQIIWQPDFGAATVSTPNDSDLDKLASTTRFRLGSSFDLRAVRLGFDCDSVPLSTQLRLDSVWHDFDRFPPKTSSTVEL
jgi:hypothetical protein